MFRRFLALFAAFCVAAALLPAVASAHDPTTTTTEVKKRVAEQVKVGEERVVAGYENGARIAPFTEIYEEEEEYTVQEIAGYENGARIAPFAEIYEEEEEYTVQEITGYEKVRVEPRYITLPAFNYVDVPQYEDVVTKKFTGYKKVRIPPYTKKERVAPFTRLKEVFNYKQVCVGGPYGDSCVQVRVEPRWITVSDYNYKDVPAYNYVNTPQFEDVVTKKFTGYKKTRIPPHTKSVEAFNYEDQPVYGDVKKTRTVTKTRDVYNYEQVPVYGDVKKTRTVTKTRDVYNYEQVPVYETRPKYETRYRWVGTGEYETTTTHTPHTCPTGYQTLATLPTTVLRPVSNEEAKVATEQQIEDDPSMATYAVYQQRLDAAHDCYRLVYPERWESDFDLLAVVIDGVTWFYKEGEKFVEDGVEYVARNGKRAIEIAEDYVLPAAGAAAKAAADAAITALEATDRFLETTLCNHVGAGVVLVSTTGGTNFAANATAVRTLSTAALAAAGSTAAIAGTAVAAAIIGYCLYKATTGDDDSDDDDSGGSVPGSVSGLSASAGAGQIAVSWSASSTVPAAGFGYRVQWKPAADAWGGASAGSEDLDHGSDLATSYTVTGLSGGSAYDVRVAAFNGQGVSGWVSGQATPTAAAPEPPSGLKLSPGDKQLAVSWSASASAAAAAAGFGYRVQWKPAAGAWGDASAKSADLAYGSNLATSHTIGGLSNGSAYNVRVAAFNGQGVSTWIDATATPAKPKPKPRPNVAPAKPVKVAADCETSGTEAVLTITWSAPASSPAEIAGYGWAAFPGSVANIKRGTVKASEGDQNGNYTVTSPAEPGKRYSVAVYSASAKNRSNYTLSVRAQCPS